MQYREGEVGGSLPSWGGRDGIDLLRPCELLLQVRLVKSEQLLQIHLSITWTKAKGGGSTTDGAAGRRTGERQDEGKRGSLSATPERQRWWCPIASASRFSGTGKDGEVEGQYRPSESVRATCALTSSALITRPSSLPISAKHFSASLMLRDFESSLSYLDGQGSDVSYRAVGVLCA